MANKRPRGGLGKGLNVIFGNDETSANETREIPQKAEQTIPVSDILINENQPRKKFDEEKLQELAESVRQYGILQPILVKKEGDKYRIIAGERRYRAAVQAELKEVPVLIREYSSRQAAEVSIIENIQREDLNPMEEAMAYKILMEEHGLKQEEIGERVSKNRTTVTNALRLLKLCDAVQKMVAEGTLSAGHARTLLAIEEPEVQKDLADRIISQGLSVRETEKLAKKYGRKKKTAEKEIKKEPDYSIFFQEYEDQMRSILGTRVHINRRDKNKGRIEIEYYSQNELERVMELFRKIRPDV